MTLALPPFSWSSLILPITVSREHQTSALSLGVLLKPARQPFSQTSSQLFTRPAATGKFAAVKTGRERASCWWGERGLDWLGAKPSDDWQQEQQRRRSDFDPAVAQRAATVCVCVCSYTPCAFGAQLLTQKLVLHFHRKTMRNLPKEENECSTN